VDRPLHRRDLQLVTIMAKLGEISHLYANQQNRLRDLEIRGYVEVVRHLPEVDAPPAWNYRLTAKGLAALKS